MSQPPRRRGHDFDQVKTHTNERPPSIAEQVDLFKFPADKFVAVRIIGPVFMYSGYWVKTKNREGKPAKFYMPSPSFDPESQSFDSTIYDPFYDVAQGERSVEDRDQRLVQVSTYGYCCAIILNEEKNRPARLPRPTQKELKSGFKEKDSDSWTPVKVLRLSSTMMEQIKGINQTNVVTNPKTGESRAMSIAHPRFGIVIRIKHSPKKSPAAQYQILPGDRSPIDETRAKYLTWDLSDLERPEEEEAIRTSYERWAKNMGIEDDGSDDDDGFDDDDGLDGDDDQDSSDDWDDGDDDGFDDDEHVDDEAPRRRPAKGKTKPTPIRKPKRKPEPEDSDDWGDDDSDDSGDDWNEDDAPWDDDDADEPPRKSKKNPSRKSKPEPEEDDWSDDGDDSADGWDDGDDSDDADSEDWGDDDGDDDSWEEEEEQPKRKPKPTRKSAPTARPARRPAGKPTRRR